MKGFIGSANIDTNSRLCMSSAVAAHKRAFGEDLVPVTYEDLELADLIVLVGSNLPGAIPCCISASSRPRSCAPRCASSSSIRGARRRCDIADLHLPLRAGTRCHALQRPAELAGAQHGIVDRAFVDAHTRGARAGAAGRRQYGRRCRLPWRAYAGSTRARCRTSTNGSARTERVVTLFSQGVNQSSAGTDKANSIINCAPAHGPNRPARRGAVFNHRPAQRHGWPRSGWACQHARRPYGTGESREHRAIVQDFWRSPASQRLPDSRRSTFRGDACRAHQGGMDRRHQSGGQPAECRSGARSAAPLRTRRGIRLRGPNRYDGAGACTAAGGGLGEKDGTVTNSERYISRQRAFMPSPGVAKAGLVDILPGRATDGLSRRVSAFSRRTKFSSSMHDCPPPAMTVHVPSISAPWGR